MPGSNSTYTRETPDQTEKKECIYLKNYATMNEVKSDIFEYVEMFYNRKRMHSYLGYMSPVEYRLAHCA